ncbi:hypothetical protein MYX78_12015 [Acidobacteria bacterium AH-259-G07]|nr:hypothetical protein [Acidobacteria bacterium AH-259-G07]
MKKLLFTSVVFLIPTLVLGQLEDKPASKSSPCHVFIDDQNIWTLEIVQDPDGVLVPILNIITFSRGQWEFRPPQIHIVNQKGREARVEKFEMDTGVPGEPYIMRYLRVLGNSFIGLNLVGKFDDFTDATRVLIDLGRERFHLQPLDCMDFEMLAEKINRINIDSPDIWEDFDVLQIEYVGERGPRPD